ncbi:MAG TPA: SDR family oxidoreductase [Rhizomicrobium sp.]|jgi:NAD(P)-dependent dehydrogenase (short-subunit alcohol dehydrogenase family)|nr:SDR family oxidoreductase [Rhizomicrobium sp.]
MKSVVVTGSSSGIGWGAAKVLLEKGFRVFGSVRREADGERLKTEFGANFVPLLFDVTDAAAVNAAAEQVSGALAGETLAGLVNNAGIAVAGPLLYLKIDEFRQQLEVNVTGQVIVTQAFAPLLGADRSRKGAPGRIVMISSVGGKNANPFMGPYCASKFAVEGLSESLRRELMLFGIDVIVIAPGAVATPIWDKAEQVDVTQYANTPYMTQLEKIRAYMLDRGPKGLKPEKLGEAIHHALTTPNPKVRYTVSPDGLQDAMVNILPKRMVDRMIGGRLGLTPKQ